jgi:hypothetical protein
VAQETPPGRVRPTSAVALLVAVAVGLAVGWFGGALLEGTMPVAPSVPWSSVLVLLFAAAALGGTAWSTWRVIHRQKGRVEPHQAVNRLILAKASSLVGALAAGVYAGYGLRFLDDLSAPLPQERVIRAGLVVLGGVLMVVAALLLERACRVPKPPDATGGEQRDHEDEGPDEQDQQA